jgi:hypothetical protein
MAVEVALMWRIQAVDDGGVSLEDQSKAYLNDLERRVKDAIRTAGDLTRMSLENATREGLGERAGGLARSWKSTTYPKGTASLNAASVIWTDDPLPIHAFETGATITHRQGRYLLIPTQINLPGGRRRSRRRKGDPHPFREVKVRPDEMAKAKAFFIKMRSRDGFLWCLKIEKRQRTTASRGLVRRDLFAGGVRVNTGHRRSADIARQAAQLEQQGYVAMYLLLRQVKMPKVLDIEEHAEKGLRWMDQLITVALMT